MEEDGDPVAHQVSSITASVSASADARVLERNQL